MLSQFDLHVRDLLTTGLQEIYGNTDLLEEVFQARPSSERLEIRQWFSAHEVPVRLGYPRTAAELPGLYVILATSQEDKQVVGSTLTEDVQTADGWNEEAGTFLRSTLRLMCWTLNANLTVWLHNIAFWMLLRARLALNRVQFFEQLLTAGDFEPLPQWFPDFAYRRDVMLTAVHPVSYITPWPRLAAIDLLATMEDEQRTITVRARSA